MRKKLLLIIFLTFIIFVNQSVLLASFPELPENEGIYLYEADSNTVIYKQNENKQFSPASITKLLTALILLDNVKNLDEVVTVGEEVNDFGWEDSQAGIWNGQQLTYKDLLNAMLIPSGNDAAQSIAINVGKKLANTDDRTTAENAFYDAMNKKAEDLGLVNSHFMNPHGRTQENHYTTPEDYVKVVQAAFAYPEIKEAASSKSYVLKNSDGTDNVLYSSDYCLYSNNLDMAGSPYIQSVIPNADKATPGTILPNPYYTSLISAAKTGSNDDGSRTYAFYSQQDGKDIYGVIMDSDSYGIFTQAKQVLETVDNNYMDYDLNTTIKKDNSIEADNISVISPSKISYSLSDTSFFDDQLTLGDFKVSYRFDPNLISEENGNYTLNNKIEPDQKLGAMLVENSNGVVKTIPIYSMQTYYPKNFIDFIVEHKLYFILGTILVIGLVIAVIFSIFRKHEIQKFE